MGFFSDFFKPRESASQRAAWIDAALGAATSQAAGRHLQGLRQASRSFETAETPSWTDSWSTQTPGINEDLARQLPTLRARSRNLARNNEWAARYLIQLDDNVLGPTGIRLQMRLTRRDGTPDDDTNTRLENAWAAWGQRGVCEVSCKLSWREVETLALSSLARDGELLYRLRPAAGPMGFQIQLLNADAVDVALHRDWGSNRVRMGVEITNDGQPAAYWIRMAKAGDTPPDFQTVGRHVRVPAAEIRHFFLAEEVDQLRGIPWLTVGARRLWLTHDFEESAAVASSHAAKRQGFFVSPNGDAPPGFADTIVSSVLETAKAAGKVLTPDEIKTITAAAEKYATTVPGQYDTLPQGYDFRPFESKWPNIQADTYIKQQIRGWAAARGMSYVTVGNDLEAVNYSSARVGILEEREHYKTIQARLIAWLHAEVLQAAMPRLVMYTPGLQYARIPAYQSAATWQPRRWKGIDPVKEATADEIRLRLKLTSRRRIMLEAGEDPDEIAAEIAQEEALYGALDGENTPRPLDNPDAPEEDAAQTDGAAKSRATVVPLSQLPAR